MTVVVIMGGKEGEEQTCRNNDIHDLPTTSGGSIVCGLLIALQRGGLYWGSRVHSASGLGSKVNTRSMCTCVVIHIPTHLFQDNVHLVDREEPCAQFYIHCCFLLFIC